MDAGGQPVVHIIFFPEIEKAINIISQKPSCPQMADLRSFGLLINAHLYQ